MNLLSKDLIKKDLTIKSNQLSWRKSFMGKLQMTKKIAKTVQEIDSFLKNI